MNNHSMATTLGRKVIALDTAEEIGDVKAFVVNPTVDSIDKIQIAGRKKKACFAGWDDLESFGDDAVVVQQADAASPADDERDVDTATGDIDILGARILDTSGFEHGTVADVEFDASTGSIESIRTDAGDSIVASDVTSLGSYALVVRTR